MKYIIKNVKIKDDIYICVSVSFLLALSDIQFESGF